MPRLRASLGVIALGAVLFCPPPVALGATTPQQKLVKTLNGGVRAAGRASGVYVVDLTTGQVLYSYKATTGRLPASVEKLYTTSTALALYGPNATLTTSILGSGYQDSTGIWHGTLYLKGGGDPTFGSASFDQNLYGTGASVQSLVSDLVQATGIKGVQGYIVGDGTYFDSLRGTPASGYAPSIFVEGLLAGLSFNRGWASSDGSVYQPRPTLFAAQQLASTLRHHGVSIEPGTKVVVGQTPPSAQPLAAVASPTMTTLLELTNTPSDNYLAETLLKDVGARFGGAGTTATGAAVVRTFVANQFGIHPRLNDGSGLSYYDSTSPAQVVTLLGHLAGNLPFVDSLATLGETGTLEFIDRGTRARGRCRGKTGTLAAVANVAGYCQAADGHTLAFAFLVNGNGSTSYVHDVVEGRMMLALANYSG
jgi:D-alanyl-D-alanine carboxypeptidase/D-alanyl-D-alanine-endopeptidase (penicillin-binding protein 4)